MSSYYYDGKDTSIEEIRHLFPNVSHPNGGVPEDSCLAEKNILKIEPTPTVNRDTHTLVQKAGELVKGKWQMWDVVALTALEKWIKIMGDSDMHLTRKEEDMMDAMIAKYPDVYDTFTELKKMYDNKKTLRDTKP